MFTNTGEVTDENTINQFIADKKDIFWDASTEPDNYWKFDIELLSEDSAKINHSDTSFAYSIIHQDGILYFQQNDTITSLNDPTKKQYKYAPLYAEVNKIDMYNVIAKYIPCIYLKEVNGEIIYPVLCMKEKIIDGSISTNSTYSNMNNEINPTYPTSIISDTKTDTIVYQENQLVFKLR